MADHPLSDTELQALRGFVRTAGEQAAAEATGVSRSALTRALAGLAVRRGTRALLMTALSPTSNSTASEAP